MEFGSCRPVLFVEGAQIFQVLEDYLECFILGLLSSLEGSLLSAWESLRDKHLIFSGS